MATMEVLTSIVARRPSCHDSNRYETVQLFGLVLRLHLQFAPVLAELERLLDDEVLSQQVKADLARRFPSDPETQVSGTGLGRDSSCATFIRFDAVPAYVYLESIQV